MAKHEEDSESFGKSWASEYILGPLHSVEPSQESATRNYKGLPTPPASASRPKFPAGTRHGSRSSKQGPFQSSEDDSDSEQNQPFLVRLLSRSNSVNRNNNLKRTSSISKKTQIGPPSPRLSPSNPPLSSVERKRPLHTSRPPSTHWNQGTIIARSNSVGSSRPASVQDRESSATTKTQPPRRTGSLSARHPGDTSHRPLAILTKEQMDRDSGKGLQRGGSLRERYPGDLSGKPLEQIKRERKLADRQPRLHNRHRKQPSDIIDSLDLTGSGVPYHHEGPFDAALQSRNRDKKHSPLEAVKDSNREALRATPSEFIQDSLERHVPLHGTAILPPRMPDRFGRELDYEEGADLMREPNADGGPYKRWPGIQYRDDDYKGKGEPSFTIEREEKERKARLRQHLSPTHAQGEYELLPRRAHSQNHRKADSAQVRQRSVSNVTPGPSIVQGHASGTEYDDWGVHRSKSSKLKGIKNALGSIRRRVS